MNIFNFLFGVDEMGDDARDHVAKNCKEGVDPRTAITDWGDEDGDHNQADHDRAAGKATNRDANGTGFSTIEENKQFYETGRPADIKIVDKKKS